MKIEWLFVIPVPIFVKSSGDMNGYGGFTWVVGPLAWINVLEKYKDDRGLIEHELMHVKQNWKTLFTHPLLYRFNAKYRLKSECEAYAEQLSHATPAERDKRYEQYIDYMVNRKYKLPYSRDEIEAEFKKWIYR